MTRLYVHRSILVPPPRFTNTLPTTWDDHIEPRCRRAICRLSSNREQSQYTSVQCVTDTIKYVNFHAWRNPLAFGPMARALQVAGILAVSKEGLLKMRPQARQSRRIFSSKCMLGVW